MQYFRLQYSWNSHVNYGLDTASGYQFQPIEKVFFPCFLFFVKPGICLLILYFSYRPRFFSFTETRDGYTIIVEDELCKGNSIVPCKLLCLYSWSMPRYVDCFARENGITYSKGCFGSCIFELPVLVADICFREAKYFVQYVM